MSRKNSLNSKGGRGGFISATAGNAATIVTGAEPAIALGTESVDVDMIYAADKAMIGAPSVDPRGLLGGLPTPPAVVPANHGPLTHAMSTHKIWKSESGRKKDVEQGKDNDDTTNTGSLLHREYDGEKDYLPVYTTGVFICVMSIACVVLYCLGLMGEQFRIIPRKCTVPTSGDAWPTATASFYSNSESGMNDIVTNAWWYFGEWSIPAIGDGLLCPLNAYDESMGECGQTGHTACGDEKYCINLTNSDSATVFTNMGVHSSYELLLSYRNSYQIIAPVVIILLLISLAFAGCLDIYRKPPALADPHSWSKKFVPVKNHLGFDHDFVWKKHRSIYANMKLQLLCTLVYIGCIWGSWTEYANLANVFQSETTWANTFMNIPNGAVNGYCSDIWIENINSSIFGIAFFCACLTIFVELYTLFHCYIKIHNGGCFHWCWAEIEEAV